MGGVLLVGKNRFATLTYALPRRKLRRAARGAGGRWTLARAPLRRYDSPAGGELRLSGLVPAGGHSGCDCGAAPPPRASLGKSSRPSSETPPCRRHPPLDART